MGRVVVETVRPKNTLINGRFSYEVLLQSQTEERRECCVAVIFKNVNTLATQTGVIITIPNPTLTGYVPARTGSRSSETQFGTASRNIPQVCFRARVGDRYDPGQRHRPRCCWRAPLRPTPGKREAAPPSDRGW